MVYGMVWVLEYWCVILLMLVILLFWMFFFICVYVWMGILGKEGFLNVVLFWFGLIDELLIILNMNIVVYIGIVYIYLLFMILLIYLMLEKFDGLLFEVVEDLGCSCVQVFWLIIILLSWFGVIVGCFLVFIFILGEFVIFLLFGGLNILMIGKVFYEEFFLNCDWFVVLVVVVILLLILVILIVLFQCNQ